MTLQTDLSDILRGLLAAAPSASAAPPTPAEWPLMCCEEHFSVARSEHGVTVRVLPVCGLCTDGWVFQDDASGYSYAVHCRCRPWHEAAAILERCGLPRDADRLDFARFEPRMLENHEEVRSALSERASLLLYGPTGTGKTHLATAILRRAVLTGGATASWLRWPDALETLKAAFSRGIGDPHRRDTEATVRGWAEVDVLVIDELGAERDTDWARTTLERLLSQALDYGARVLATTNLPPETLEGHVGARVWSRLLHCRRVTLSAADYRARGVEK